MFVFSFTYSVFYSWWKGAGSLYWTADLRPIQLTVECSPPPQPNITSWESSRSHTLDLQQILQILATRDSDLHSCALNLQPAGMALRWCCDEFEVFYVSFGRRIPRISLVHFDILKCFGVAVFKAWMFYSIDRCYNVVFAPDVGLFEVNVGVTCCGHLSYHNFIVVIISDGCKYVHRIRSWRK